VLWYGHLEIELAGGVVICWYCSLNCVQLCYITVLILHRSQSRSPLWTHQQDLEPEQGRPVKPSPYLNPDQATRRTEHEKEAAETSNRPLVQQAQRVQQTGTHQQTHAMTRETPNADSMQTPIPLAVGKEHTTKRFRTQEGAPKSKKLHYPLARPTLSCQ